MQLIKTITNKKTILVLVFLTALFLLVPDLLLAEEGEQGETSRWATPVQSFLWLLVNGIFGTLVWIGGTALNTAVTIFVIGFGDLYANSGLGAAVDHLWEVVRDIFNLTFIFGLVYIGFKMILRSSDTSARQMLVHIILAALLVNFSLFFTKFVVDFSNIAASQVAQAFDHTSGTYEVSDGFANVLGLSSIWDNKTLSNFSTNAVGSGYPYIFGTMLTFMIVGFVFLAGAILLLIRFVALNLFLIFSPIMFLGWVFPGLASYSREYWRAFLGRAFFAPAYLLMLYISYYTLSQFSNAHQGPKISEVFANGKDSGDQVAYVWVMFLITCIFLVASILVAQKMGVDGANAVVRFGEKTGRKVTRTAGSVAFGLTYPIRYPIQAGARNVYNRYGYEFEKGLNNRQASTGFRAKIAKWNWVDKKVRGAAEKMQEAELGTGTTKLKEDAYKRGTEARAEKTKNLSESLNTLKDTPKDTSKSPEESAKELSDAFDKLGKTIKSLTTAEKAKLGFEKLNSHAIASNLSDDDINSLEKTDKFSSQQIQDIRNTRNEAYTRIATHGNVLGDGYDANNNPKYSHPNAGAVDKRPALFNRNVRDIGKMPVDVFKQPNMFKYITPAMLEERIKNGLDTPDREKIREALSSYLQIPPDEVPKATGTGKNALGPNNPWVKWINGNSAHASQFFS